MVLPDLVLVHGGAHAGDCWELTVAELARQAPELRVLAVDLPGRGGRPADLSSVTIADFVNSVVADIADVELGDVVVVGHSMAGLVVPGVAAKLGAQRVRELIFLAAFVPPQGSSVVHTLRGPLAPLARSARWLPKTFEMPSAAARFAFCNGMTRDQRRLVVSRLCRESPNVIFEPVDRSDLPEDVPRTWIMTLQDRRLLCLDSCHAAMVSDPGRLASILADRCRLRARN
jgi:pimeloyl-ACP methyl ester carboxylesterase